MIGTSSTLEKTNKRLVPMPHITEEGLKKLVDRRERLLPVESHAREQIDTQIAIGRVYLRFPDAKILDESVLRWRHLLQHERAAIFNVPVPKLALINISNPTFYIKRGQNGHRENSILPSGLPEKCYDDILRRLNYATAFLDSVRLSFTWHGLIPEASVSLITEATEFFGDYGSAGYSKARGAPCVYLLTEAPAELWSMDSKPKVPRRIIDPLILGQKGNKLFVVGSFDPTPLEQYIASEFAT